jgi:AhpD family alkylhydroperoxidase
MHTYVTAFEQPRLDYYKHAPEVVQAMATFDSSIEFDPELRELVKVRASMLNGCAFCLEMHTRVARAAGETEHRLYALAAWQEAPVFSERERAALALADAITLVAETHVPREVYDTAARHFDERELAQLIWAICAINAWNRVALATRMRFDELSQND